MTPMIAAVVLAAEVSPLPLSGAPPILSVYGVSTDSRGVTVHLASNGCVTLKSDFTVAIAKTSARPTVLFAPKSHAQSLVACRASGPTEIVFTWSYDDLGLKPGQPFSLANPFVVAPGS